MKISLAASLICLGLLWPDTGGLLLLGVGGVATLLYRLTRPARRLSGGDLQAAWIYENLTGEKERADLYERMSGSELATLLEACVSLQCTPHQEPEFAETGDPTKDILARLRVHRIDHLKKGRDREAVSRFVRAVESQAPRHIPGEHAVRECRRLSTADPDLVLRVLKNWLDGADAFERFHASLAENPVTTLRLVEKYHQHLDQPALTPDQEVAVFLSLLDPDHAKAFSQVLPPLSSVALTKNDEVLVAQKLLTELWSETLKQPAAGNRN